MTARFLAVLLLAAALPAQAETYKWIDEKGRVTYSNTPPPQVAGMAQQVEERISVMGMDSAVRAWTERRYEDKLRADQLDWELRQQTLSSQYDPPATYAIDGYGADSPYYYGGIYRPIYRHPVHARHRSRR
jgi:hypothetical protein